jgi:predicted ATPase with chaperone activity
MSGLFAVEETSCDLIKRDVASGPTDRPQSLAELDVSVAVLEDLALKMLYMAGAQTVVDLSERLCLSYSAANGLFERLRAEQVCHVTGMAGNVPQIAITAQGRTRAADLMAQSRYVGPAPVSFDNYAQQVRKQSVRNVRVHAADVERAFADLVVDPALMRQLGTAVNSGSSVFLYGPPGTGKTTFAEMLSRVLAEDEVWIPHAVEVDGQIITVFDSAIHKSTGAPDGKHDPRWVLCERPAVLVGGELTAEMLDLQFNPISRFYVGPMQMKANNGVLIIDDFGRQRLRPEELLNRWIVPLDRRIDFLTMVGGKKIEIPFEMLVVFASNLDPAELVDPAFIRRIKTKIRIGAVTDEQFGEIFARVAQKNRVKYDDSIPKDLIDYIRLCLGEELRACYPRDIVEQVCWAAQFDDREPYIDRKALGQAICAYFSNEKPATA